MGSRKELRSTSWKEGVQGEQKSYRQGSNIEEKKWEKSHFHREEGKHDEKIVSLRYLK